MRQWRVLKLPKGCPEEEEAVSHVVCYWEAKRAEDTEAHPQAKIGTGGWLSVGLESRALCQTRQMLDRWVTMRWARVAR